MELFINFETVALCVVFIFEEVNFRGSAFQVFLSMCKLTVLFLATVRDNLLKSKSFVNKSCKMHFLSKVSYLHQHFLLQKLWKIRDSLENLESELEKSGLSRPNVRKWVANRIVFLLKVRSVVKEWKILFLRWKLVMDELCAVICYQTLRGRHSHLYYNA